MIFLNKGSELHRIFPYSWAQSPSLYAVTIGHQRIADGPYKWGPGVRNYYDIHQLAAGRGFYQMGGKKYALKAGDAFMMFPGMAAEIDNDPSNPWEYFWIGFNGADAPHLLKLCGFTPENPIIPSPNSAALRAVIDRMFQYYDASPASSLALTSSIYQYFSVLMQRDHSSPSLGASGNLCQKATSFIKAQYTNNIQLEDVCFSVNLSRSQLYRIFMQDLGMSPTQYLLQLRMNHALELIKESGLTIAEIAYSVGYDDPLYFSRVFRKYFGDAPTALRKSALKSGE